MKTQSETSGPAQAVTSSATTSSSRLMSLDAYRGFVMLLMASFSMGIPRVAKQFPDNPVWKFLAYHFDHVEWTGCGLWDLIQPSFMFMVGVAVPYSIASRFVKGETLNRMFLHAVWRAFILIVLAVFLSSLGTKRTEFVFVNVLAQIGLGYPFLFLLAWTKPRTQWIAAGAILVCYWAAFAAYSLPPPEFDYAKVGVPADWPRLQGFAAHWNKNTNLAAAFDQWFLNLFPRATPFVFNDGGYQTLNFIPSLATMIFGLLAGGLMRSERRPIQKFWWLVGAGGAGLVVGKILDVSGICPSVKRIWTPSWAVYSAGWTCLLLAAFYGIIDLKNRRRWAFPLMVVGMNSIAIYLMAHLFLGFIGKTLKTHFGQKIFELFGETYAPILERAAILLVLWLITFWMYRRKLFLKI